MRLATAVIVFFIFIGIGMGEEYIEIKEATMLLKNGNAIFEVEYELDSIARLYVLALGCKYIEPDLHSFLTGFDDLRVVRAEPGLAVLLAKGASEYNSGYHLFDSRPLGSKIAKFTVVYPGGLSRTFYNVSATPSVFCKD